MSLLWYWRYIPCYGVEVDFENFVIYEADGKTILSLRRSKNKESKLLKKHIVDDMDRSFHILKKVDFEASLSSSNGDGQFSSDSFHVFLFLLLIRNGGWVSVPVILTHSTLEDPEIDGPHVYCEECLRVTPASMGAYRLTSEDAEWIKTYMETGLRFVGEPKFQNAMQALTSFHCIPYPSTQLLIAWSGLEALFGVESEISFRLSLYITNFLKSVVDPHVMFRRLRRSYDDRSRIAHGASTKAKAVHQHAQFTRDILRECLAKCIEQGAFPDREQLIFQ